MKKRENRAAGSDRRNAAVALLCVAFSIVSSSTASFATDKPDQRPLKIFILAGQSNMGGMGMLWHLHRLLLDTNNTNFDEYRRDLWNGTAIIERDDAYVVWGNRSGKLTANSKAGIAYPGRFGPELGFGTVVGKALGSPEQPVLLVKVASGKKSLAVDFRPPSSGRATYIKKIQNGRYGSLYRYMIEQVKKKLLHLGEIVPAYDERVGYKLAGFVWFQGFSDSTDWHQSKEYRSNLINLIRDVRRDLQAPDLPFVIGELGMYGGPTAKRKSLQRSRYVLNAQISVTQSEEFHNSTLLVRTAPYMIYNETIYDGPHHYHARADTIYPIGKAFGYGMLQLLSQPAGEGEGTVLENSGGAEEKKEVMEKANDREVNLMTFNDAQILQRQQLEGKQKDHSHVSYAHPNAYSWFWILVPLLVYFILQNRLIYLFRFLFVNLMKRRDFAMGRFTVS